MRKTLILFILLCSTIAFAKGDRRDDPSYQVEHDKTKGYSPAEHFTREHLEANPLNYGKTYYPDYTVADQGITIQKKSIKYFVDTIGATNKATIYLRHNSGAEHTDYVVGTDLSFASYSNISIVLENGARLSPSSGKTLTLYSPANIIASPNQEIFTGAGSIGFATGEVLLNSAYPRENYLINANTTITVPTDFTDINAALNYLQRYAISKDATVTISVAAGTHTYASSIVVNHPYGSHIKISGATPVSTTISSVGSVTGSAGNWSVPITVASATGIAAGQYVIIKNATGTGDFSFHNGVWLITDVTGSVVTITNTCKVTSLPTHTVTGGDVVVPQSIISTTSAGGLNVYSVLGEINNVIIKSTGTSNSGIRAYGSAAHITIGNNVGVSGFSYGISAINAASIVGDKVYVSGAASHGIFAQTSSGMFFLTQTISNGNGASGISANTSGSVVAYSGAVACGNGGAGIWAGGSAYVYSNDSGVFNSNKTYGVWAVGGGGAKAELSEAKNNVSVGYFADAAGYINATSATADGNANGFYAYSGGVINAASSTASNNTTNGYYTSNGGIIYATSGTANTNANGYNTLGGIIYAYSSTSTGNSGFGYYARDNGTIIAILSTAITNGTADYGWTRDGWINADSAVGSPTFFPAGTFTIATSAATTTVTDSRVTANCIIIYTPRTANAAAELASGNMYISAKTADTSFTVTHTNSATTGRTFDYTILNK